LEYCCDKINDTRFKEKNIKMQKKIQTLPGILVLITLFAAACSSSLSALPAQASSVVNSVLGESSTDLQVAAQPVEPKQLQANPIEPGLLAAYENTLINIYDQVNPSVVNIRVISSAPTGSVQLPDMFPNIPQMPNSPDTQPPTNQSLGSGFVWDTQGNIITNNHVVNGADKIEVTFSDDTVATAELVGTDPDSDLAVIHVNLPPDQLVPVQIGDSDSLRVGQLAIAIGNPFGLEGTMTVGIISALGRSLPASDGVSVGPVYSIPDVIQTDAPINPGNSGGVLLNDLGQVIGVTAAIESPVRANAGVGFVIPASIVNRVVPELIKNGSFEHPYLGISGISLFPDLAAEMNLDKNQRGAMVAEVVPGGPADKAGLLSSDRQVSIDGQDIQAGGDVITAVDGQIVNDMDDLIAYLSENTVVGQEVSLTILRDGRGIDVTVTLGARPGESAQAEVIPQQTNGRAWLGITGMPLTPEIAAEMGLSSDQTGVLVVQVQSNSPAEDAGLHGGDQSVTINGQEILVGGDVIVNADGNEVTTVQDLASYFQEIGAGNQVSLTILRDGKQLTLDVTLGEQP
jgi:serine protease Do